MDANPARDRRLFAHREDREGDGVGVAEIRPVEGRGGGIVVILGVRIGVEVLLGGGIVLEVIVQRHAHEDRHAHLGVLAHEIGLVQDRLVENAVRILGGILPDGGVRRAARDVGSAVGLGRWLRIELPVPVGPVRGLVADLDRLLSVVAEVTDRRTVRQELPAPVPSGTPVGLGPIGKGLPVANVAEQPEFADGLRGRRAVRGEHGLDDVGGDRAGIQHASAPDGVAHLLEAGRDVVDGHVEADHRRVDRVLTILGTTGISHADHGLGEDRRPQHRQDERQHDGHRQREALLPGPRRRLKPLLKQAFHHSLIFPLMTA
ncbi:hypothetical protein D3C86_1037040 [compost metagenome]